MNENPQKHFAIRKEEGGKEDKKPDIPEEKLNKARQLAQELKAIMDKANKGEKPLTQEDLQRAQELKEKIQRIFSKEKKIIGWKLEGELTKENVLVEYKAEGQVYSVSFSPEGDKVAIGSGDQMMKVISLTEKDEKEEDKPKVLAQYKAGGWVYSVSFSPEGDKVAIGSGDDYMKVIGKK
jgi:hypothetical protein